MGSDLVLSVDVKRLRYSRASLVTRKKSENNKRVNAVKSKLPETKEFIDDSIKGQCQKEKMR